jgi:CBS domain-containing protein
MALLRVRDAMSSEVFDIPDDATLQTAARRMVKKGANSLIVRPEGAGEPYGIITSKDVVDAIAADLDPTVVLVRGVATAPLVTISPGVPLEYAARLMKRTGLRHLAVFNGRKIVGVLSSFDFMKALATWSDHRLRRELAEVTSVAAQ